MHRTKIKICGIRNLEDALFALECGVEGLGFVFYTKSPRFITINEAHKIIQKLPPFVTICGLFVNAMPDEIKTAIAAGISMIQFHGDEQLEFCNSFQFPYIRALRIEDRLTLNKAKQYYQNARAILLDAYDRNFYGGLGKTFDWSIIPNEMRNSIILAGGLTVENVTHAIAEIQPYAVDVSGGVESQKGIKSHAKIKAFCDAVKSTY
ncbi:phosphoribosylanthranilate isomerase [Fastidiosibacter lacustris]|uniref:phosphoribosylanthranilate isomerase n=1 Tax=Fastidiosibacter lacustris TaxID=2056695 RepID=UPI000E346529|nr:phosphoribosylanthranilate isomerase [Fastidiosibacter lacustris]